MYVVTETTPFTFTLSFFSSNIDKVGDKQVERFHQDITKIREHNQGDEMQK